MYKMFSPYIILDGRVSSSVYKYNYHVIVFVTFVGVLTVIVHVAGRVKWSVSLYVNKIIYHVSANM